jgi:hypothetical protein
MHPRPQPREYWAGQADTDERVRVASRNAPASIKRSIDRERQRQGLAPLWNVEQRSRQPLPDTIVLVGGCCPGRSAPVTAGTDGLHLPEEIAANAFDHSLRMIKAKAATVEMEAGHGGEAIASTADGTLAFTSSEHTGLMAVARVKVSRLTSEMLAAAIRGRMGLSVSMLPRRVEIVKRNGKRVRVIREVELKALAALWDAGEHGKACYPAARMYAAFENDKRAVRRAMRLAGIHANTAVLKAGWR